MMDQPILLDAEDWAKEQGFSDTTRFEWRQHIGADLKLYVDRFEGPPNDREAYGDRYTGFLHAPSSDDYTFYLASDDEGELWLSNNDNPANLKRIAWSEKWTSRNQLDKFPTQKSEPVRLKAGFRYSVMALHKDGDGADHFSVFWSQGKAEPSIINGRYLCDPEGNPRRLLREVWIDVPGPQLKGLTESPRYKMTEPTPIKGAETLRAQTIANIPGNNIYRLYAVDGDVKTSTTIIVTCVEGLREALTSMGYKKLAQERQVVFQTLMSADNPIAHGARRDLGNFLAQADYLNLDASAQTDALNEFIRHPRLGQTSGPEARARRPFTLGEPYKIEPYEIWSGEDGPEWRRDMQIDGRMAHIDSYEKDMVQVNRAAKGLAGMPDPLRDFVRNVKIVNSSRNEFNGSNGTIFIRLTYVPSQQQIDSTFCHEIGHTLEGQFSLREAWDEAISQDDIAVSKYGNSNMSEDFADFTRLYAAMVLHENRDDHQLDKLYPHRYALMKKILNSIDVGQTPETPLTEVSANQSTAPLSLYAPQEEKVGWGRPRYNEMMDLDTTMRSGDADHEYGIFAHAPARHVYHLKGQWKKFTASVGLFKGHAGSVVFVVQTDGHEAYRSELIDKDGETPLEVDVTNIAELELIVEDGGDGASHDWGMWFSPIVSR